jgi:lipopolysaccharide transport system ATP-binding protein
MAQRAIAVENVSVAFRERSFTGSRFWAIRDVTFTAFRGDRIGIIGKNGAGKSTLLRVIAGSLAPDKGTVRRSVPTVQLLSLGLGFMSYLSGRDNAVLGGLFLGFRRKSIEKLLPQIESTAALGEFFEKPLTTYSAGMKARLGFAVATLLQPDVLLLDETLSVGDATFQKLSKDVLDRRVAGAGTLFVVSHVLSQIESMCNKVIWMHEGQVILAGEPETVLAAYRQGVTSLGQWPSAASLPKRA